MTDTTGPVDVSERMQRHAPRQLARGVGFNLLGQGVPLIIAFVALPFLVRGLGTDAFGAFQLAWAILGSFALLDLGLGRATTKFVAEHMARGEERVVTASVATALSLQAGVGVAAGVGLAALAPWLSQSVFSVEQELLPSMILSLRILAGVVPVVLLTTSLLGVLHAVQRFDLANLVQGSAAAGTYLLPLPVLWLGGDLVGVVATVALVRGAALVAATVLAWKTLPRTGPMRPDRKQAGRLLAFGGWVAVTNLLGPLLVTLDRYVIGMVLPLSSVAFYTAPQDVITRLTIVPGVVLPPVFAAVAAASGVGQTERVRQLLSRVLRYILLLMVPAAIAGALVARPGLAVWLGDGFARAGAFPAQILLVGMVANAAAQLPYATLQAAGRADLPARFHLIELPLFAGALAVLVTRFGLVGAALAWTGRAGLDALLLLVAASRVHGVEAGRRIRATAIGLLFPTAAGLAVAAGFFVLADSLAGRLVGGVAAAGTFALVAWKRCLDAVERALVTGAFQRVVS